MSVSIRSTVEATLSNAGVPTAGYADYINAVVAALEEREFTITETVVAGIVDQFGVDEETVTEAVKARTNLEFRPIPEPVVVEEEEVVADEDDSEGATKSGGKGKRIAALEASVAEIKEAVNTLTALAKRHLG